MIELTSTHTQTHTHTHASSKRFHSFIPWKITQFQFFFCRSRHTVFNSACQRIAYINTHAIQATEVKNERSSVHNERQHTTVEKHQVCTWHFIGNRLDTIGGRYGTLTAGMCWYITWEHVIHLSRYMAMARAHRRVSESISHYSRCQLLNRKTHPMSSDFDAGQK
jgi:hypothetical protein